MDKDNLKLVKVGMDVPAGFELVDNSDKIHLSDEVLDSLALKAFKDGTIRLARKSQRDEKGKEIQEGVNQMAQLFSALEPNGSQQSSKKEEEERKKCTEGHILTNSMRPTNWICNGCRKESPRSAADIKRYRCQPCNYDICEICYNSHGEEEKPNEEVKDNGGILRPDYKENTDTISEPSGTSTLPQDETDASAKEASIKLKSTKLYQSSKLTKACPISEDFHPKKLQQLISDLHSHSLCMEFDKANPIYQELLWSLPKINGPIPSNDGTSLARIYNELAFYHYQKYDFSEAFGWSMKAVEMLSSPLIPKDVLVDVIQTASNICIQKSEFVKAELLITEALRVSKQCYGENHPKYALCLIDYGRYLQSIDYGSGPGYKTIKSGVEMLSNILGENDMHVAIAYRELAYASYSFEYVNTMNYTEAKESAEKSLTILTKLVSSNHILSAITRRYLGIVLEEMGRNTSDQTTKQQLFKEVKTQYLSAKESIVNFFGENHSLTALVFGDLGQLYKRMNQFQESEQFLLKSLQVTEFIHGSEHVQTRHLI